MYSQLVRFSHELESKFSSNREEDILKSGDYIYKCKFPLQKGNFYCFLRALPMTAVSQNNQLKIVLMP